MNIHDFLSIFRDWRRVLSIFKKDNRSTWMSFLLDLILGIIAIIVEKCTEEDNPLHLVAMIAFFAFSLIFLLLALAYVYKWHGLVNILRRDPTLSKTCSFLAKIESDPNTLHSKGIRADSITINYFIKDAVETSESTHYPVEIDYELSAKITEPEYAIVYHALTHKESFLDSLKCTIKDEAGNEYNFKPKKCSHDGDIMVIHMLNQGKEAKCGEKIKLLLHMELREMQGISSNGTSRLLFYASNIIRELDTDSKAVINLYISSDLFESFDNQLEYGFARIKTKDNHDNNSIELNRRSFDIRDDSVTINGVTYKHFQHISEMSSTDMLATEFNPKT